MEVNSSNIDVAIETNSSFLIGQNNITSAKLKGWIDEVDICNISIHTTVALYVYFLTHIAMKSTNILYNHTSIIHHSVYRLLYGVML